MKKIVLLCGAIITAHLVGAEKSTQVRSTSPLFVAIEQRVKTGFSDESLRKAELILSFPSRQQGMKEVDKWKYSPNFQDDYRLPTPLDRAAEKQDKDLCLLFFKYGGNPHTTSKRWIEHRGERIQISVNAFHYAVNAFTLVDVGRPQPGWFMELWEEHQAEQDKK